MRCRGRWIGVTVVLGALLAPQESLAACAKADAAGAWDLYAMWSGGRNENGWTSCSLVVSLAGKVKKGKTCQIDEAEGREQGVKLRGGKISVKKSCEVAGSFEVGGCSNKIDEAWMTKDKGTISGVGKDCQGAVFQFNAVKAK